MNLDSIKVLAIYSFVLGLGLGVLGLVPFVGALSALVLFMLASVLVMFYALKRGVLDAKSPQEAVLYGAGIGFLSLVGFSVTFLLIALLIGVFFTVENWIWISSMFSQGVFVPILMVIFVGILSALTNAFSAMAFMWILQNTKKG